MNLLEHIYQNLDGTLAFFPTRHASRQHAASVLSNITRKQCWHVTPPWTAMRSTTWLADRSACRILWSKKSNSGQTFLRPQPVPPKYWPFAVDKAGRVW